MAVDIVFAERAGWHRLRVGVCDVMFAGDRAPADQLAVAIAQDHIDGAAVQAAAAAAKGHFAAIVSGPAIACAMTDHCRSTPVFLTQAAASNDAHALQRSTAISTPDPAAIRDAAMAGFVTGGRTLYAGLNQLEAGAYAIWQPHADGPQVSRHTIYQPEAVDRRHEDALVDDLLGILDDAIDRVLAQAGNRPIWVPLSGGLDSRVLLAKFVERGGTNLFAFTYGPRGNDEVSVARTVARRLEVPWRFFPSRRSETRRFFDSSARKAWWNFADGLSAVPNFQDFLTLRRLAARGGLPDDVVIVNGQTGDFITGGHIPAKLMVDRPGANALFEAIVAKHFSLWNSLKTTERLSALRSEVLARFSLSPDSPLDRDEAIAHYERFEFEERQAKYVINGQRNYEHLARDWALPLWDAAFVAFWRNIPVEQKYRQKLFRTALARWNYRGLFRDFHPHVGQWPGMSKAVLLPSRAIRLALGRPARDAFLKRMLYFGLYQDQYAPFGLLAFLEEAGDLRNPVSLLSRAWLAEQGLSTEAA